MRVHYPYTIKGARFCPLQFKVSKQIEGGAFWNCDLIAKPIYWGGGISQTYEKFDFYGYLQKGGSLKPSLKI